MNPIAKTLDQHKQANRAIGATAGNMAAIYRSARERLNAKLQKFVLSGGSPENGKWMVELITEMERNYASLAQAFASELGSTIPYIAQSYYHDALVDLGKSVNGKLDTARIDLLKKDVFNHVAGMTNNMQKSDVQWLRQTAGDVLRLAGASGMSSSETKQMLLGKIFARPESFQFIDAGGRRWDNRSYCDMLTRTTLLNAGRQTYFDTCSENGYDVVRVTVSGNPCPDCAVWENRLLSITGNTPGLPTVEDAIAAGLCHPNCTHSFVAVPDMIRERDYTALGRPNDGINSPGNEESNDPEAWKKYQSVQTEQVKTERTSNLTENEVETVNLYTSAESYHGGDPFYAQLNEYLRNRTLNTPKNEEFEKAESVLRLAIGKSIATKNIVAHRGISSTNMRDILKNMAAGDIIPVKQFESTSSSMKTADGFAEGKLRLKINIPNGSHVLPIKNYSKFGHEKESLLMNTGNYQIVKLYYPQGQSGVLVAEVNYVEK